MSAGWNSVIRVWRTTGAKALDYQYDPSTFPTVSSGSHLVAVLRALADDIEEHIAKGAADEG